ncbi:helix-turn-helix domain-containing protein [Bacteroidota bacterium]
METDQIDQSELMGREEVAKMLRCNLVTLWRYTRDGKIPYYRAGRKMLFRREEILEAIKVF